MYRAPQSSLMRWMEAPNCSIMHSRPPSSSTSYYSNNVSSGNNWAPTSTGGLHKASFLARTARKKNGDPRTSSRQAQNWKKESLFPRLLYGKGTARKGMKITLNLSFSAFSSSYWIITNSYKPTYAVTYLLKILADLGLKCPSPWLLYSSKSLSGSMLLSPFFTSRSLLAGIGAVLMRW